MHTLVLDRVTLRYIYILIENPICLLHWNERVYSVVVVVVYTYTLGMSH